MFDLAELQLHHDVDLAMAGDRAAAERVIERMKMVRNRPGGSIKGDKKAQWAFEVHEAVRFCKQFDELHGNGTPLSNINVVAETAKITGDKLDAVAKQLRKARDGDYKPLLLVERDFLRVAVYSQLHHTLYPSEKFLEYLQG
jgi:hypothetical protein